MTRRRIVALALLAGLSVAIDAAAQSGDGSLRGVVKDEQGAVMPGVAVTATSPDLLTPAAATITRLGHATVAGKVAILLPGGTVHPHAKTKHTHHEHYLTYLVTPATLSAPSSRRWPRPTKLIPIDHRRAGGSEVEGPRATSRLSGRSPPQ